MDVILLGAGVSGLSAGLELARRGIRVTLLDRGSLGGESTWAGAGILFPLLPWQYGEDFNRLALASLAHYPDWIAFLRSLSQTDPEYVASGLLVLPPVGEGAEAWCATHGFRCSPAPEDMPGLASPPPPGSLWLPQVAHVRNPRLARALAEAIRALGGHIEDNVAIEDIALQDSRLLSVRAGGKIYEADNFVLATGAWSRLPLANLPALPAIRPVRGQMLLYPPGSHRLQQIIYQDGFYLVPRKDGHLLAGSTLEFAGYAKEADEETRQRLHRRASNLLGGLPEPIRHWAGIRPGSPDNLPIIGPHPDFANLYLNVGHFRYGVTLAPTSARLLADQMTGAVPELPTAPYSLNAALARTWPEPEV